MTGDTRQLIGRDYELKLVLSAVIADRDLALEGTPGSNKTTIWKAITAEWSITLQLASACIDRLEFRFGR